MATKRELRALRTSICRGVRDQLQNYLLATGGTEYEMTTWEDPQQDRTYEGPHVGAECQRVYDALNATLKAQEAAP